MRYTAAQRRVETGEKCHRQFRKELLDLDCDTREEEDANQSILMLQTELASCSHKSTRLDDFIGYLKNDERYPPHWTRFTASMSTETCASQYIPGRSARRRVLLKILKKIRRRRVPCARRLVRQRPDTEIFEINKRNRVDQHVCNPRHPLLPYRRISHQFSLSSVLLWPREVQAKYAKIVKALET